MEAFVNSFVDIFVCFLHCLVVSDQYSLKNAITGQIFYQKSHISVTLSLPDSTKKQNQTSHEIFNILQFSAS